MQNGRGGRTIKDIAEALGLAHSTVSRALNDHPRIAPETKARVRQAASEMNYIANSGARLMRSGASRLVALIVPDIQNDFYSTAAKIMASYCASEGFQLLLAVSEDDPDKEMTQVQTLREARVAGVVIAATANPRRETIRLLRETATVQFLRRTPQIAGPTVRVDDLAGTQLAARHVIGLGHRRVGYIGVFERLSTGKGRLDGYAKALQEARLAAEPELMHFGSPQPAFGREALLRLLDLPRPPTAVVVASPRHMLGVLEAVCERSIHLPEELSVVAYSDSEWLRVWRPRISAVELPIADMAATAASLLFWQIRRPKEAGSGSDTPFAAVLRIRESTGRCLENCEPCPRNLRSVTP